MSPTLIVQSLYLQSRLELITLTYGRVQTAFPRFYPSVPWGHRLLWLLAITAERSSLPLNESVCGSVTVPLQHLNANSNHLKLMHVNTQSMCSTFNEFQLTVESYPLDILTLSKTWLKENLLLMQYVQLPGYVTEFRNRENHRGGGVAMYIKDNILYKRRKYIEDIQPDLENLRIEVAGRNKHSKLLLGAIYRPTKFMNTQSWLAQMETLLSQISACWDRLLVITGDMNIDMKKQEDVVTKKYQNLLDVFNLIQVSEPTRTHESSSTIIDHIITKITRTGIIPCSTVSDHDGPYVCINIRSTRFEPRFKYIRNMKTFDADAFIKDCSVLPFNIINCFDDPDDQISCMNKLLMHRTACALTENKSNTPSSTLAQQ